MNEHKHSGWAVFFSVFCGVLCGWVAGQELQARLASNWAWLAWTGCVVSGGLIGYIFVDPWGFFRALPVAGRLVWGHLLKILTPSADTIRRYKFFWQHKSVVLSAFAVNISWWLCLYMTPDYFWWFPASIFFDFIVPASCFMHSLMILIIIFRVHEFFDDGPTVLYKYAEDLERDYGAREDLRMLRMMTVVFNPVSLCFIYIPFWIYVSFVAVMSLIFSLLRSLPGVSWSFVVGLCRCVLICKRILCNVVSGFVSFVWSFLRNILLSGCRFCWHVYRLTHTSALLIAMGDAALFAGVVYFTNDLRLALTCALVGGIWGSINLIVIAPRLVLTLEPVFVKKK